MKFFLAFVLLAATLAGCSFFGSGEPSTLDLAFRVIEGRPPAFRMTFDDGGTGGTFLHDDFERTSPTGFEAGPFEIHARGYLRLACSVLGDDGRAVATASLRLPLHPGWRYSVTCAAGAMNPYRMCFGCKGYAAQSLDAAEGFAPGDSLYLVWAGDPKSNPNVY